MKKKELIKALDDIEQDLLNQYANLNKEERDKLIGTIHKVSHLSGYLEGERLGRQHHLYWIAVFVLAGLVTALRFLL